MKITGFLRLEQGGKAPVMRERIGLTGTARWPARLGTGDSHVVPFHEPLGLHVILAPIHAARGVKDAGARGEQSL